METFSALLAICAGNSRVPGDFPAQRPVTRSFDVFFDLRLNKRLCKHLWSWWFETPSHPLWRHCNASGFDVISRFLHLFTFLTCKQYLISICDCWSSDDSPVWPRIKINIVVGISYGAYNFPCRIHMLFLSPLLLYCFASQYMFENSPIQCIWIHVVWVFWIIASLCSCFIICIWWRCNSWYWKFRCTRFVDLDSKFQTVCHEERTRGAWGGALLFFKVIRQISRPHLKQKPANCDQNWMFPDCNSSLNSPMAMKWCTKFEVAKKRRPIVFQKSSVKF